MSILGRMRWILLALVVVALGAVAHGQVAIAVTVAPPELPVYEQPLCPEEGWMWVPGYWAWGDDGYYWVPGQWVPAPYEGALWTPPWWGWEDGRYLFHDGYWGDDVGYYGGIDYGYGYMGVGFVGGEWRDGRFAYNTAVMRVDPTVVRNTYVNETVVRNTTIVNDRRVAYTGGPGGVHHDPTPVERRAMTGRHTAPTPVQQQEIQAARSNRTSYAKVNNGRPQTVVVARPAGAGRNEGDRGPNRNEVPGARQQERPGEMGNPSRNESRPPSRTEPEYRTAPDNRPESRPAPGERPRDESRPEPQPRNESRPMPEPRNESRPTPEPRNESRPAPEPRYEQRPAPPAERPRNESRPAPPPRESRPEPRPEPHHESRPAPQPHPDKQKPE